jgi:tetratricopeptide (TPR) repeat protein
VEDVASGRVLFARSVRGEQVFPLIDELTEHIRTSLNLAGGPAGRSITELTSESVEAYRLYTEGLEARNNLRRADARDLFQQAVEIDPSFGMAYYRLWEIAQSVGQTASAEEYRRKTLEYLDRLPERQKLLVQARYAFELEKNPEKALALLEQRLARYPDEEDAYFGLWVIYNNLSQPDKALSAVEQGVKALPNSGSLHNQYGYGLLWAATRKPCVSWKPTRGSSPTSPTPTTAWARRTSSPASPKRPWSATHARWR